MPPLSHTERQPCEIWTRIMGYHRPTSQMNAGKKKEWQARRLFFAPRGKAVAGRKRGGDHAGQSYDHIWCMN